MEMPGPRFDVAEEQPTWRRVGTRPQCTDRPGVHGHPLCQADGLPVGVSPAAWRCRNERRRYLVLGDMGEVRRDRCWSAVLFALPWPLPVYALVGSFFIVVNERLVGEHVFDASRIAEAAAFLALLGAAAWSEAHDQAPQR